MGPRLEGHSLVCFVPFSSCQITRLIAQSRKHEVELLAEVDTVFSRGYFVNMVARL